MNVFTCSPHNSGTLRIAALYLLGALFALGPLNSKVLGAAWLFFWVWVFWIVFKTRHTSSPTQTISSTAASVWVTSCIISLVLAGICAFVWAEEVGSLNAQLRLLLPAAAALAIIRRGGLSAQVCTGIFHVLALACVIAFAWTAFLTIQGTVRYSLASNAIPWAVAISFYPCLLLPRALQEKNSARQRWIWLFGTACGIGAVLLSQSRGAFLIIPWCCLVYAWFWYRKCTRRISFYQTLLALISMAAVLLTCSWFAPGDAFRIRQAAQEIKEVQTSENYNSSTGARLYLWAMAWEGIQQSPWLGIGGAERLRRIQHAGEDGSKEEFAKLATVRELGHVHNQYLHSAWDGGLIELAALLSLFIGMAIAVRRLAPVDSVAAWQLGGVLFMHATSNLSNVNFAHNYYAVALSLATVIPLLTARRSATATQGISSTS